MAFDGFVTRRIALELKDKLVGGRIEKIYHPNRHDIVFVVSNNKEKFRLFMSADSSHFGIYLTEEKFDNPKSPTAFNMLLRKHLEGSKIKDISSVKWERIIEITIYAKDEMGYLKEKKIIVEIMNKQSNIVLVEAESLKIIDALKRTSFDTNSLRQLLPSMVYAYPPLQDKISPEDFINLNDDDLKKYRGYKDFLNSIFGISPAMAISLSESTKPKNLMRKYVDSIYSFEDHPKVYLEASYPRDFHFLNLSSLEPMEAKIFNTMSEAISFYYTNRLESNRLRQKSSDIEKRIKSLTKKLYTKKQRLLNDIEKAKKSSIYKLYGELITANIYNMQKGKASVELLNYYDNRKVLISLDINLSPIENAQKYFKKYNKSKRALVEKNIQIDITNKELEYLNSTLDFLNMAETTKDIDEIRGELIDTGYIREKKITKATKNTKSHFTTYKAPSGLNIYVGKNNKENDYLSTKFASKSDLWFHTKDISSSHVILSLKGESPTEEDIIFASQITAYYSKARNSENVPVDYTYVKFVKKPKGAKLGMVIFTNNKTVYVNPKIPEKV